jgi:triacylglycerol esterase/lipase EstA (alpha/beta hydrolase family)
MKNIQTAPERPYSVFRTAALLICLHLTACAAVTARHASIQSVIVDFRKDILDSGELSQISRQYLATQYLMPRYKTEPEQVIRALEQPGAPGQTPDRVYTLAETALARALSFENKDSRAAADWHIFAAAKAYDAIFNSPCRIYSCFDPRHDRLRLFYARAVAGWIVNERKLGSFKPEERTVLDQTYRVSLKTGPDLQDPNVYLDLMLATEMKFEGLSTRSLRRGIGVSLVGWRENKQETQQEHYYPRVGLAQALSAMALFSEPSAGVRQVELAFFDSLAQEKVAINGEEMPLAADFTAAFGYQVSKSTLKSVNIAHTMDIEAGLSATGFYMLAPYNPDKIPLITVHGLLSSPITWIDVNNQLLADPELRRNFQIWHFYYPPGLPIMVSASMFREKLDELYRTFDPGGNNPKLSDTIVLSHSMGGLITRTAVSDSSDAFWLKMFGKTEKELSLPADLKSQLDKLLDFEHRNFIKRVVFVAVPHRGSNMSESLVGRIGRSLVSLPAKIASNLKQMHEQIQSLLLPEAKEALVSPDELNSIRGLSPNNPAIQALSQLAISRGVQVHSIIGTESKAENGEPSDGVVPYSSAHLEGVASELTVPTGHSAHTHPLAIMEIERILRLHLHEYQARHPEPKAKAAPPAAGALPACAAMY